MAASSYKYICIRENGEILKIASQSIVDIIEEYNGYAKPFASIIRQDLYSGESDYQVTKWRD